MGAETIDADGRSCLFWWLLMLVAIDPTDGEGEDWPPALICRG